MTSGTYKHNKTGRIVEAQMHPTYANVVVYRNVEGGGKGKVLDFEFAKRYSKV